MNRGKIYLFGTFQVHNAQHTPLEGASPRVQALAAYLALHQGEPLDRRRLAFLLWPRVPESVARRNLRQYLHRLRQFLHPIDPEGDLILTESLSVTFDPQRTLWVDAQVFQEHLTRAESAEGMARLTALRTAVELYRGDLLQNIYDDWSQAERERYRQRYEYALQTLIATYESLGRLDDAIYWAERALQTNPLQETIYRALMRLYHASGDRARALETYERCRQVLADELQTDPMPETQQLYREILAPVSDLEASWHTPAPVPEQRPRAESASAPPVPTTQGTPAPPLIGREADLKWLHDVIAQAAPAGALILVDGEAGIGKTRLITEWLSRLRNNTLILIGEAGEFEHIIPYHPLKEALQEAPSRIPWQALPHRERWEAAIAYLLPTFAQEHLEAPHPYAQGHVDHWMILEGVGWFLRALAERRPTLLWIDEAHWADHPTWQTIAYLGQRLTPHVPLFILITAREEDIAEPNRQIWRRLIRAPFTHRLTLQRLTRKQTYELARAILGPNADTRVLERLYTTTEGNPLFIVETARALVHLPERRVFLHPEHGRSVFSPPERVRQVVESRLDLLPEEYRALLQVAAVFGQTFTVDLLQRVVDVDEATLLAALDTWLRRGLVRETAGGYTFSHALVRHGVYNELSQARRRWLHRRVAHILRDAPQAPAATVAYHFAESDQPHHAIPFFIQAAEDALSVRSYHEAKACALEVLRLWRQQGHDRGTDEAARIDVNLQVAQAYSLSNLPDEALPLLEETRRLAEQMGDPHRLARVLVRLAQVFWHRGNPQAAQDHARAALRWAETAGDQDTYAAALRMLGRTEIVLSAFDDAIITLRRHLDEVDASDHRQAVVWSYLAVAWARVGQWLHAFEAAQRAVQVAESHHSPSSLAVAYMHLAFVQAERRYWTPAAENAQRGLELTAGLTFTPVHFMAQAVYAYARGHLGSLEEAVQLLENILEEARRENYRVLVYLPHYFLGMVYYHHRAYREALQHARHALTLARAAGDRWAQAVALRLEADTLSALPHPDWQAIEDRLVRSVTILRQVRARPDLARSYLSLRRLYDRAARMAWAVDCHFRALRIFEELGMVEELRSAQGTSDQHTETSRTALTAPLAGPEWLRSEPSSTPEDTSSR